MSNKLVRKNSPVSITKKVRYFEDGTLVSYGEYAQNVYIVLGFRGSGIGAVNIVTGSYILLDTLVTELPKGEVLEIIVGD